MQICWQGLMKHMYVGTYFLAEKHNCHLHRTTYSISNDTCLLGIQVKIWKYSEILEAIIVGKKMNADNNTRNIMLILVSCLMSLEVQSGKNLPSSQKLQLWTSKDIKPLTEIKIIFLVLLSAFIFLPTMSASSISEHFHILTWIPN